MIIPARSTADIAANREEWAAALESGRYAQGAGVLRRGNAFCCLGVACDIAGYEWEPVTREHNIIGRYMAVMPTRRGDLLRDTTTIDRTLLSDALALTTAQIDTLIGRNDSGYYSFTDIANFVRDLPIDERFTALDAAAG